jgi:hypothetical protein
MPHAFSDYDRWKLRSPDDEADRFYPQEPPVEQTSDDIIDELIQQRDELLSVLKFAGSIIGHPDDAGSKLIADTISKAEAWRP